MIKLWSKTVRLNGYLKTDIMYHIQGTNRISGKKEIITRGFQTEDDALNHLKEMARYYFKTHRYARVAKTCASNLRKIEK